VAATVRLPVIDPKNTEVFAAGCVVMLIVAAAATTTVATFERTDSAPVALISTK
jgi:hypothetical protein